jgi:uncharacterized protein YjbI with pentapeptide repeats
VTLSGLQIGKYAGFQLDFSDSVFYSPADFKDVEFRQGAKFEGTRFEKGASFQEATFDGYTTFANATFVADTSFSLTEFGDICSFEDATFETRGDFTVAEFNATTLFHRAQGGVLNLRNAKFRDSLIFRGSQLNEVRAYGAEVDGLVSFRNTELTRTGGLTFDQAVISGAFDLRNAVFQDSVQLGASFRDRCVIDTCTFEQGADFSDSDFHGPLTIRNSGFESGLSLNLCYFGDTTRIEDITVPGKGVSFKRSTFAADTFISSGLGKPPIFEGATLDFSELQLDSSNAFRLINADLSQARLLDTDVRLIDFAGVNWQPKSRDGWETGEVYDERLELVKDEPDWPRLEVLYRGLKQAYEDQRDFGRAGDFHYREKEIKRLNPKTPRPKWFLLSAYYAFSGYGERLRAGGWFVALVLFCAITTLAIGLESEIVAAGERVRNTDGNLTWRLDNLFSSILYSLQVAFVRRPENFSTSSHAADFVRLFTMVTGPILIGLFALAVRQKLKR